MKIKATKNNQIIISAIKEFLDKGFQSASMHSIAENAEVSKRTLYKYYPKKDDLYSSLIDELLDRTEENYTFQYKKEVPLKKQLEKIILQKAELVLSESYMNISKIVLGELLRGRKPTDEQMERIYKSEYLFERWVKKAQRDCKVTKKFTAEEIASQFHAIFKSKLYWPTLFGIVKQENPDIEGVKKTTVSFFMNTFSLPKIK